MCSELFRIPYSWGGVPIFGVGVLLVVWAIVGLGSFALAVRRHGWNAETLSLLPLLLLTGAAIVGLPRIFPSGLPVRGYGVMVLAGAAAGVLMATHRAQRAGIDRELIWSMGVLRH
jgi:phosphatidylglycerol:prolipoprotein diacylglycerol transferase